jgi:uncharacterized protein (TIGR02646 family)
MKYIKKGASPRQLTEWFNGQPVENGDHINCRYEQLDPEVKNIVEQQLLQEQGWLCCYTGMSISGDNFHIEHLIPRSISKSRGTHEDVDYQNMLAAYPKGNCPFGAKIRENKPIPITPLQPICEYKFQFDLEGNITGVDEDATYTINCLRLDHEMLDEMRKAAIDEALFPDNHRLSQAQINVVIHEYCSRNRSGKYPKFCFVIAQAAQQLLGRIDREKRRQQAIQRKGHR